MKSTSGDRIADLGQELDAIHSDNVLFWKRGANNSREARVQHQLRLNRLDEIMKELASAVEGRLKEQPPPQNKSAQARHQNKFVFMRPILPEDLRSYLHQALHRLHDDMRGSKQSNRKNVGITRFCANFSKKQEVRPSSKKRFRRRIHHLFDTNSP